MFIRPGIIHLDRSAPPSTPCAVGTPCERIWTHHRITAHSVRANACSICRQELTLLRCASVSYYTDLPLPCFTNIRRLELDGDDDMPTAVAHDAVVAADSAMLCELTLRGPALLIHPRVVPLLYHGSSLQSLSIVLSFPFFYAHGDADPVLSIFGNSPAILPNITSFKLLLSAKASREGVVALSSF